MISFINNQRTVITVCAPLFTSSYVSLVGNCGPASRKRSHVSHKKHTLHSNWPFDHRKRCTQTALVRSTRTRTRIAPSVEPMQCEALELQSSMATAAGGGGLKGGQLLLCAPQILVCGRASAITARPNLRCRPLRHPLCVSPHRSRVTGFHYSAVLHTRLPAALLHV